jgi:hypothetical protein
MTGISAAKLIAEDFLASNINSLRIRNDPGLSYLHFLFHSRSLSNEWLCDTQRIMITARHSQSFGWFDAGALTVPQEIQRPSRGQSG